MNHNFQSQIIPLALFFLLLKLCTITNTLKFPDTFISSNLNTQVTIAIIFFSKKRYYGYYGNGFNRIKSIKLLYLLWTIIYLDVGFETMVACSGEKHCIQTTEIKQRFKGIWKDKSMFDKHYWVFKNILLILNHYTCTLNPLRR